MKTRIEDIVKLHKPLRSGSLVVDCGGYKGDYSQYLLDQWNPYIIIFEPVPDFYEVCRKRFETNMRVKVLPYALGEEVGKRTLYVNKEGSSFYREWARSDNSIEVDVVKLSGFLKDRKVDILEINCEGAEFAILEDLNENNLLRGVYEIMIQFHRIPNFNEKYPLAVAILEKTHNKVYDNKWQLWRKK